MEDTRIELRFDNRRRNDNINSLVVYKSDIPYLEHLIKRYTGWRTPTKKHNSIWERFLKSGSTNYDNILNYLITQKINLWTL